MLENMLERIAVAIEAQTDVMRQSLAAQNEMLELVKSRPASAEAPAKRGRPKKDVAPESVADIASPEDAAKVVQSTETTAVTEVVKVEEVKPVEEVKVEEVKPVEVPAAPAIKPAEIAPAPSITLEDVRFALVNCCERVGKEATFALLTKHGQAATASAVNPVNYPALMKALNDAKKV